MARFLNFILLLNSIVFLGGCRKTMTGETEHPSYLKGRELLGENLYERALSEFLKVIKDIPHAQKSYLEAGQIYLNTCNDPVSAIYYFRQFLLHNQQKQHEKIVTELIETAKKRFLQQIIGKNKTLYNEHHNFLALLKHLRDENTQLKMEIEQLKIQLKSHESGKSNKNH
jgi:hypothetical protein